jgi:hypothetical protein
MSSTKKTEKNKIKWKLRWQINMSDEPIQQCTCLKLSDPIQNLLMKPFQLLQKHRVLASPFHLATTSFFIGTCTLSYRKMNCTSTWASYKFHFKPKLSRTGQEVLRSKIIHASCTWINHIGAFIRLILYHINGLLGGRIWRQSYPSSCLQENDCSQNSNPYLTITSPRLLS